MSSQSCGFPSSHVSVWELDHKESWVLKNWCFWAVVLDKTLESPLDCKGLTPVNPKGNQSWIFIGRTDAEAEAPIIWSPDWKNWLIGKDSDAGKIEGRRRRGWHRIRWLYGINLMSLSKLRELVMVKEAWQSMPSQRVGHNWATELNNHRIQITWYMMPLYLQFLRKN